MTARYPSHPDEPWSKLDDAINRGFDPGEEYYDVRLGPITPAMARYNHQGAAVGCDNCGERCDDCGDRMCSKWGPEPRACSTTCQECPCDCRACLDQRQDMRDELLNLLEREAR